MTPRETAGIKIVLDVVLRCSDAKRLGLTKHQIATCLLALLLKIHQGEDGWGQSQSQLEPATKVKTKKTKLRRAHLGMGFPR